MNLFLRRPLTSAIGLPYNCCFTLCVDNYMIVMSLLTRFCLFRAPVVFTVENEPKPYKLIPQSSVPMAAAVFY